MIEVRQASTDSELESVRGLTRRFMDWLRDTYPEAREALERDSRIVETELGVLPGAYQPPAGKLLLAYCDGIPTGTVALHGVNERTCEMQRMFVEPGFRGKGVGRALATAIMSDARALGFTEMRLSTGVRQVAAQRLYHSLGFTEIAPYHAIPTGLQSNILFMSIQL